MPEPVYNYRNVQLASKFQGFEQSVSSTRTTQTADRRLVTRNRLCRYSLEQQTPTLLIDSFHSRDHTTIPLTQVTPTRTPVAAEAISHRLTALSLAGMVFGCPSQALAPPRCSEALASKTSWDDHTSTLHQTLAMLSTPASGTKSLAAPTPSAQACFTPKTPVRPHASSSVSNAKPGLEHLPRAH